jgi:heme-degrading monooxygenase HmoA
MYARVSFYELGAAEQDDVVQAFEKTRASVEQLQGNRGGMVLLDPDNGKGMTITLWEDEDALRATEHQAEEIRQQAAAGSGTRVLAVEAYEVALNFGW